MQHLKHAIFSPPGSTTAPTAERVDVVAVLTNLADQSDEKLDWRRSIVDLMKLLDLDSSLAARKQLAQELHYSGSLSDSASMNVWLHRQVMQKLAENGGKVPVGSTGSSRSWREKLVTYKTIRRPANLFSAPGMSICLQRSRCLALIPAGATEVRKRRAAGTA